MDRSLHLNDFSFIFQENLKGQYTVVSTSIHTVTVLLVLSKAEKVNSDDRMYRWGKQREGCVRVYLLIRYLFFVV